MTTSLIIALSLSADALGIGISYGIRRISFPPLSALLLTIQTCVMMFFFIATGRGLASFLPVSMGTWVGNGFLLLFGLGICLQGFRTPQDSVLHQPSACDKDGSKVLEPREALLLGFILSIDSLGVGVSASATGIDVALLPLFAGLFQILFLLLGARAGKNLPHLSQVRESLWTILSGVLLIALALFRIFFDF